MAVDIGLAFLLTFIAGISTSIGSIIAYFFDKPKLSFLAFGLGLSAGVMVYVSFVEMLAEGQKIVGAELGTGLFFIGIFLIGIIDVLFPEPKNPHHVHEKTDVTKVITGFEDELPKIQDDDSSKSLPYRGFRRRFGQNRHIREKKPEPDHAVPGCEMEQSNLKRMGIMSAVVIAIHNFPEGIAVFGSTIYSSQFGFLIMLAIAIHNIPEGISVSLPIYYATCNRKKAFKYSFLSGFTEPLGAVVGYLILMPFLSDQLIGGLLSVIAGIMVYISIDELIPAAHKYGQGHIVVMGVVSGMALMAISLLYV